MNWWWWWATTDDDSGGSQPPSGVPEPLTLPTDWPPIAWGVDTPRRVLFFQPCQNCCDCVDWSDHWQDDDQQIREELGDDWQVESGTWYLHDPLDGYGPYAKTDAGVITTRRRIDNGRLYIVVFPQVGQVVRIYFDWLDATHHQYLEITREEDETPIGVALQKTNGKLSIYRVDGGAPALLAGPELLLDADGPVHVQFADTAVENEKIVAAEVQCQRVGNGINSWLWCHTTSLGDRWGFGGTGGAADLAFGQVMQTDCTNAVFHHVFDVLEEIVGGANPRHIRATNCFYGRPCGWTINAGQLITGDWYDLGKSDVVLTTTNGVLDVTFTVYLRAPFEPRYVGVQWDEEATMPDLEDSDTLAVWNFALQQWESAAWPSGAVVGYDLGQFITDDNVDGSGRVACRLVLKRTFSDPEQAVETEITITNVVGGRNEYPLPNEYTVELGADWPEEIQGLYHMVWDPDIPLQNHYGCWHYTTDEGVYPGISIFLRFQEDWNAGLGNQSWPTVYVWLTYKLAPGDLFSTTGGGYSDELDCCAEFDPVEIEFEDFTPVRTCVVSPVSA